MDLLLDVNIVLDICEPRPEHARMALEALEKCRSEGGTLWLYAGSAQTLHHVLAGGLLTRASEAGTRLTRGEALRRSSALLKQFTSGTRWLAALAGEGDVFAANDPEDEQLVRALDRFADGRIRLLTRDEALLSVEPRAVSPRAYLQGAAKVPALDFIDLASQQHALRGALEARVHRVLHHGQYIMGREVAELEAELAAYTTNKHCITVASGTDALLIAMMALGIEAGDEIITSPFTFIATGEMIALLGAKPVFVDIDPSTYNLDPALIEAAITPRTRAIMPVNLYGQCADFDTINDIANRHGLPVIEDAAQSFGATYKGRKSCALSTIGCTSFFPSKPLGCYGDGGACFTDDGGLAKLMREIRDHGQSARYEHARLGLNSRLDTLQAAVLFAKLTIFPDEVAARGRAAARYDGYITARRVRVRRLPIAPNGTSVYAQYTIEVEERSRVIEELKARGIPTAVHYPRPLHLQPVFRAEGGGTGQFPVAEALATRVVSLPMHPYLVDEDQVRVIDALANVCGTQL